ncbi:hypothetical protein [Allokutzneria sp. NRRL B-24872]|uniref:hypothetical protein n=1 Tax=Allokutzneria sp. NRRL B-24872 TaxID=1137961 RepID=UPI000A3D28E2|nr:hypothetical protein [Allokutzneria sp. NRRL B-24872]
MSEYHSSVRDVSETLRLLAQRLDLRAGEAAALHRARHQTEVTVAHVWVGSTHDAAYTARAHIAVGVAALDQAVAGLRRVAQLLRDVAARM